MKITKRVSVGFSEDDYYIMKGRAKEARLTMSAYLRMKAFAAAQPQYIPQSLPALNRPPRAPKQTPLVVYGCPTYTEFRALEVKESEGGMVLELKLRLASPDKGLTPIEKEEELLKEVEIK